MRIMLDMWNLYNEDGSLALLRMHGDVAIMQMDNLMDQCHSDAVAFYFLFVFSVSMHFSVSMYISSIE